MQGKKHENKYVFKREQKTGKVVADVTSVGRLLLKRWEQKRRENGEEMGRREGREGREGGKREKGRGKLRTHISFQ